MSISRKLTERRERQQAERWSRFLNQEASHLVREANRSALFSYPISTSYCYDDHRAKTFSTHCTAERFQARVRLTTNWDYPLPDAREFLATYLLAHGEPHDHL